ncbi:hypothetical protein [Nostoc sp.]|uniref:hypothetical protein n=1 Tax=Nostoc sp. TaxID=1180 RepID=UPI002FF901C8
MEQTNQYYQELGNSLKPRLIISSNKFGIQTYLGLTHQVRNVGAIHELPLREIKAFSALKA